MLNQDCIAKSDHDVCLTTSKVEAGLHAAKAEIQDIYYNVLLMEAEGLSKHDQTATAAEYAATGRHQYLRLVERGYYAAYPEARQRVDAASYTEAREL